MTKPGPIKMLDIKGDFTVCPECGYDGGFHSIFPGYRIEKPSRWMLMCPGCKARFDIGLEVSEKNVKSQP